MAKNVRQNGERNAGRARVSRWRSSSVAAAAFTLAIVLSLVACRPSPQFQEHYNIPKAQWASSFQPRFQFDITDTAAAYQLFLLIRHTDAYAFSNIWLRLESRGPMDNGFKKILVEVPLAAASGRWLGRGMGEIWEQRVPINSLQSPAFFPHAGRYTVRLTQEMRRDPLPEVLTIGLRVEKLPPFQKGGQ